MTITGFTSRSVTIPADDPLVVGLPARNETREFVTLELHTDHGVSGVGIATVPA